MSFVSNGSLTTDERETARSSTWDSQADWEAYQAATNVEIVNGTVQLSEQSLIDSFEDGDYAEYSGNIPAYDIQSDIVTEGSLALYVNVSTTETSTISSTSGLPYYPQAGDTVRWEDRGSSNNSGVFFAVQTEGNVDDGYMIRSQAEDDLLQLYLRQGGSFTLLDSQTIAIDPSQWYGHEFVWGANGSLTVNLYSSPSYDNQIATISATDSTYSSGGVGFRATGGGSWYVDYIRVV